MTYITLTMPDDLYKSTMQFAQEVKQGYKDDVQNGEIPYYDEEECKSWVKHQWMINLAMYSDDVVVKVHK